MPIVDLATGEVHHETVEASAPNTLAPDGGEVVVVEEPAIVEDPAVVEESAGTGAAEVQEDEEQAAAHEQEVAARLLVREEQDTKQLDAENEKLARLEEMKARLERETHHLATQDAILRAKARELSLAEELAQLKARTGEVRTRGFCMLRVAGLPYAHRRPLRRALRSSKRRCRCTRATPRSRARCWPPTPRWTTKCGTCRRPRTPRSS